MVLLLKVDEARGDPESLESVEDAKALGLGEAEVLAAVDDELGRAPLLNEALRIPPLVLLRRLPRRSRVLALRKVDLLCRTVIVQKVSVSAEKRHGERGGTYYQVADVENTPSWHTMALKPI